VDAPLMHAGLGAMAKLDKKYKLNMENYKSFTFE
jgi:hypothetical protein